MCFLMPETVPGRTLRTAEIPDTFPVTWWTKNSCSNSVNSYFPPFNVFILRTRFRISTLRGWSPLIKNDGKDLKKDPFQIETNQNDPSQLPVFCFKMEMSQLGVLIRFRNFTGFFLLLVVSVVLLSYQACSPTFFGEGSFTESASTTDSLQRNGNGDTYDGKGTVYVGYDTDNPCSQTDSSGKPLPNAKLAVEDTQTLQFRKDCQDQTPTAVDDSRLIFSSFNKSLISFEGLHYQSIATLPPNQIRYVSNVCRGELSSTSDTRLFEVVFRGNENWVSSPTYTAEVFEAVENSDQDSVSQKQIYPEEEVQRSVNGQGQLIFSRSGGPRPLQVTVGSTGQSSVDLTVGGENYSGNLSCDFEPSASNLITASNDFTASIWLLTSGTGGTVGLEANSPASSRWHQLCMAPV